MRSSLLAAMLCPVLVGSTPSMAPAQRNRSAGIPSDVSTAIASVYNATDTQRERGSVRIARDSVVRGSLAIRGGPATIAGHVTGSLVIINSDVTFEPGAKVDGEVYVVGGKVEGRDGATIGSDFRAYAETLRYRISADNALVVEDSRLGDLITNDDDGFWQRKRADRRVSFNLIGINGANTYNRVEGLPILIGPRLRVQRDWGTLLVQGRGIVRTAEPIEWNRESVGHDARAEVRFGYGGGFGFGGAAYDRIDAIESWQLSDKEAGLTAVGVHRDYRDYFSRHGATGFVKAYLSQDASLTLGYSEEHWESRDARHPWSLFRDDQAWRPNPVVDDGHTRLMTAALNVDQRSSRFSPGAGWFVHADVERGKFEPTIFAGDPAGVPLTREYTRGFLDVRRYNRLAPHAQLNLRMVAGGWLNGDELPLERRLSVSGPGTLPGFDFRSTSISGEDRLQCSEAGGPALGVPAMCDRVALFQVEYRGDLAWSVRGDSHGWLPRDLHFPAWSVFFDAGRGWRAKDDGLTTYSIQSFPDIDTFKTDAGIGLDFGIASVAVAKSISDRKEPFNWVIRLSRRF